MNRISNWRLVAATSVIALLALVLSSPHVGQAQGQGAAPVRVVNTAADPVPVVQPQEPFQDSVQMTFSGGGPFAFESESFQAPQGKLLVIEFVSIQSQGTAGRALVRTSAGGSDVDYHFPLALSHSRLIGAQVTRLYADPGSQVSCTVIAGGVDAGSEAECSFSGYLVPVP